MWQGMQTLTKEGLASLDLLQGFHPLVPRGFKPFLCSEIRLLKNVFPNFVPIAIGIKFEFTLKSHFLATKSQRH